MGKINDKMRKRGSGTNNESNDISQGVYEMYDRPMEEYIDKSHHHTWHFATDYRNYRDEPMSKFACLCGAVKRVKQFEVEE